MPSPIKRHPDLQPVSREHHHGLLLSFKIRQGIKYDIDPKRVKKYVDWFWANHLEQHFEFEEQYIFPILPVGNELVEKALADHKHLKQLFASDDPLEEVLSEIEAGIVAHIRFEERVLFQEVEKVANEEQLAHIKEMHELIAPEEWPDEFWNKK
ncbi:hemerythrin domain-containing protein [Portibacter lacus]|uniref:Hemerythrin domain-containing protein n=1 Tax=Portibacter lacus TaxID=1099794 RepID=A0AA37SSW2_9BACT|nr:hemerythrin domain-containing protein [Portibacter lacus]GLR19254.1 hypothetical protein GCM10007940_38700 [Portibacter lacus]